MPSDSKTTDETVASSPAKASAPAAGPAATAPLRVPPRGYANAMASQPVGKLLKQRQPKAAPPPPVPGSAEAHAEKNGTPLWLLRVTRTHLKLIEGQQVDEQLFLKTAKELGAVKIYAR